MQGCHLHDGTFSSRAIGDKDEEISTARCDPIQPIASGKKADAIARNVETKSSTKPLKISILGSENVDFR